MPWPRSSVLISKTSHVLAASTVLLIAGFATAQSPQSGPMHFFPLDGSVVDLITGVTPTQAEGYTAAEGFIGGAIHLDGTGVIDLPVDLASEAVADLTIVAMVKPDALPDDANLRREISATGYVVSDSKGLIYLSNQNKDVARFAAYSTNAVISNSDHPVLRDGWQMIALTRKREDRTTADGEVKAHTVLTLFSNGQVSETVSIWKDDGAAPTLRLGAISAGNSYKFRGSIDHLSIFDRALTPDELREMNRSLRQSRGGAGT